MNEVIGLLNEKLLENSNTAMVGKLAPLFTAQAYYNGTFTNINLEDYRGKWVYLCFYPGDFTFV